MQDENLFNKFVRKVEAVPFAEFEWEHAVDMINCHRNFSPANRTGDYCVELALWFFVKVRMSLMGMGESFAPLSKTRTRRGMNEQVSAWLTAVEGLGRVHQRLRRVVILNQDAPKIIKGQDSPQTFFFLDPTYYPDTRTPDLYEYEMTPEQHEELLDILLCIKGKAMLCGYMNPLYEAKLKGWTCHQITLPNSMGTGKIKQKRIECLWTNYSESIISG